MTLAISTGEVSRINLPRVWVIPDDTGGGEVEVKAVLEGAWTAGLLTGLSTPTAPGVTGPGEAHHHSFTTSAEDARSDHVHTPHHNGVGDALDITDTPAGGKPDHTHTGPTDDEDVHKHPIPGLPEHDHPISAVNLGPGDKVLLVDLGTQDYLLVGRYQL